MTDATTKLLINKIDEIAVRTERSHRWVVKRALSAWVDEEETRERMTHEALANVDAGLHSPHSDIRLWAESFGQL